MYIVFLGNKEIGRYKSVGTARSVVWKKIAKKIRNSSQGNGGVNDYSIWKDNKRISIVK